MNRLTEKTESFLAIKRVLESHNNAFEGKPNAIAFRDSFFERTATLSQLSAAMVRPVKSLYTTRRDQRLALQQRLLLITDFGIMLAKNAQNNGMLTIFLHYKKRLRSISVAAMLQVATDELQLLDQHRSLAEALGLPATEIQDLQQLITDLRALYELTQNQLDQRRNQRLRALALINECQDILKFELDKFVSFHAGEWPVLSQNYSHLRRRRRRHQSNKLSETSDIIGTVSDAGTGLPVAGATVKLIEQGWSITTDADGDFLFDELPAGHLTLSCHASGYEVPEIAAIVLGMNDHVVWNFQLTKLASGS
jgi:hypothetical protein